MRHAPISNPARSVLSALAAWLIAGPATASLEADFITSAGTITVPLQYDIAPRAAANLVTLAEGSRTWTDSLDGKTRSDPFFDDLTFFPLPDGDGGLMAATGSRTGDGTDNPGYTFPEETSPSLTHQPYTLTMVSPGPNRNGSCLAFTGSASLPARDTLHTVLGTVTDPAGRTVIDAILAAPAGTISLGGISIRRTDPAAIAFDEHSQSLPAVSAITPQLAVTTAVSTEVLHPLHPNREIHAHSSTDLAAWAPHFHIFADTNSTPPAPSFVVDDAVSPSRFYRFVQTSYPDATGCSSLADRTLTTQTLETDTFIYHFDGTGQAGTYQNIVFGTVWYEGLFEIRQEIPPRFGPYDFEILLHLHDEEPGGSPFHHIRGGLDSIAVGQVTGRHTTTLLDPELQLVFDASGPLQLSRP